MQEDTIHYLFSDTSVLKGNKTKGMCGEEGRIKRGMNHLDRLCLDKIMGTVQYVLYCCKMRFAEGEENARLSGFSRLE